MKIFLLCCLLGCPRPLLAAANTPARNEEGLTPLHVAAGAGDVARMEALLAQGADLFALDSKMGVSALHKAIYSGKANAVELLLKHGALVNLQSPSNGDTPLHDAIYFRRGKDLSVIRMLLLYRPSLAIRNRAGLTPIDSAKILHADDVVSLLESYEQSRQSATSRKLMAAVRLNQVASVRNLLQNSGKETLAEADDQGFTPLLWAAREGFTDLVVLLVKHGADPNQNDQWMGANAGHKAAFWGRTEVMKVLVAHGLALDARGGYNGYTPLHDAVSGDHVETARVLVEAGANPRITGHDGKTPADIAKANGDPKMMALFAKP